MNQPPAPERFTSHAHRLIYVFGFLLVLAVALRRQYDLSGGFNLALVLVLMGIFTLLYASEGFISRRFKSYPRIYFFLQVVIVQALGLFRDYQDTWSLLYIVLGFQVAVRCARKEAAAWFALFAVSLLATLSVEFGIVSGLGRALAYGVIGVLFISYDIQYGQHEDALAESQMLVLELEDANQKLVVYAAQAEKLAAEQERSRMIQELYDSVGQKIFAIQLAAETARLVLEKDPGRAEGQIEDLQGQTQTALDQMRQLIGQWRPG